MHTIPNSFIKHNHIDNFYILKNQLIYYELFIIIYNNIMLRNL
jgi:hypothetical protein